MWQWIAIRRMQQRDLDMRYRRVLDNGGTYFFTVNLANRKTSLLTDEIDALRYALNTVKKRHPFIVDAMVVMPDHLHAIFTLPESDSDYATRWMLIKSTFSRQIPRQETISRSRKQKGERGIWQRRYWEHKIRDARDFEEHVNYIHVNPVKHGYVTAVAQWPYSTFHQYVEKGILDSQWGKDEGDVYGSFGE
ncbi:transposase [Zhongshania sp.]|uniref:REP-associated tyrosine transposase n=1 Tax=Zhongshania sp. TaxID=1971902 RepID=UPI0025D8C36A|nr:transposase [Zhongshania sp.]